MMKTLTFLGVAIFLLTFSTFAQKPVQMEYGKLTDLKGVKKIFIDTGTNTDIHNYFFREITKAKLPIEITEASEQADFVLYYRIVRAGAPTDGFKYIIDVTTPNTVKELLFLPKQDNKIVVIYDSEEPPDLKDDKTAAKNFLASFVKTYKDANGLK